MGKTIALTEWAQRNGMREDNARQKAGRGGFKTARKIGRDWTIDEDEPKVNLPRGRTKQPRP